MLVLAPQQTMGSQVEERLRRTSQTGRIRFSEFFKDYDPLKSGVITSTFLAQTKFERQDFDQLFGRAYSHSNALAASCTLLHEY